MTVTELYDKIQSNNAPVLIDVREDFELRICKLENSLHIPMGDIPSSLNHIPTDKEVVIYCHHGVRSMQVVNFLVQKGFNKIHNLDGGINAWSLEVDSSVPVY